MAPAASWPKAVVGGMAVLLSIVACSGSSGGNASQTLIVDNAINFQALTMDPARGGVDVDVGPILHAIYEPLLTYKVGDTRTPQPLVAESYSSSTDARTFTFKLRKDVKFSDGTGLTSADVVFTYNRLLNLNDIPAYLLAGVTGVSAPDPYTFVITSQDPNPAIPSIVTALGLGIENSKVVKAHGGTDAVGADKTDTATSFLEGASAGSGPYVLVSADTTQIVLKPNPNYWGPNKPTFQNVIYRDNVAAATQQIDAQKATNEIELSLTGDQAQSLKGQSNLQVLAFTSANTYYTWVNASVAITKNPHLLQAIKYAIDYQGLAAVAGPGSAQAAGVIPPAFLGALPQSQALKYDPVKAKAEMDASGLTNPTIPMDFVSTSTGLTEALASKIKANLAAIGITLTISGAPTSVAAPHYRSGTDPMALLIWYPDYPDPTDYGIPFSPGGIVGRHAGWPKGANPDVESLAVQASSTADPSQRSQMFQQWQSQLNNVGPIIPLINPGQSVVATKNLTNVVLNPVWLLDIAAIGSK